MTNQVQVFENEKFGKVRTVVIDGQPWWVLSDICSALKLSSPHKVAERLDSDEKGRSLIPTLGGTQKMTVISESGLYSVILRSDKQEASAFRRWITHDVVPSIRKHNAYITPEALVKMHEDNDFAVALVEKLMAEKAKNSELSAQAEQAAPKIRYYDNILQATNLIPVTLIAKDYGFSAISFNKLLGRMGIQFRVAGTWVLAQPYANKGYAVSRTYFISEDTASVTTYWTQKGRHFLYEFLHECGIVPVCEAKPCY